MPSLVLRNVRKVLEHTSERKKGYMYWTRHNKKEVYLSWDPEPGVNATGIALSVPPEEAVGLRDWLLKEFPLDGKQ